MYIMSKIWLVLLLPCLLQQKSSGRNVESSTLIQLDDCTCLGYTQTFECTVFGGGFTVWMGSAFSDCRRNEIQLRHSEYIESQATGKCNGEAIVARSLGSSENCYISELNVTVGQEMINETIECIHSDTEGASTKVGQKVLSLSQVPYPPPSDVRVEAIEKERIVFAWSKLNSSQCSSIQYIIVAINCGVCPNTTNDTNITCVQFSVSNQTCMFAVQTEICGYLLGERSEYVIINLFVPSPPKFKLRLHYSSQYVAIETEFDTITMAISDNIDGSPTSYNITYSDYTSGVICGSFSIPAATCQNGVCRHMSRIMSPCSPNDDTSVSVLSTNILGSGPLSQPVVFSVIANDDEGSNNVTNITSGGAEATCDFLVLRVVTVLSVLLITTIIITVTIIVVFTVVTVKLFRDRANMKQVIKVTPEQDDRKTIREQTTGSDDYEDINTMSHKASDMNINENAAYSTINDL